MCERLKQAVLKTAIPERVSGVRIPLPPPLFRLWHLRLSSEIRQVLRLRSTIDGISHSAGKRFLSERLGKQDQIGSNTVMLEQRGFAVAGHVDDSCFRLKQCHLFG